MLRVVVHWALDPVFDLLQDLDAIDEVTDGTTARDLSLHVLLSVLTTGANHLPGYVRFLITTRPEAAVLDMCRECRSLDMGVLSSTEEDITQFVRTRLLVRPTPLKGIDDECCRKVAQMSQGLFQWASVACNEIENSKGSTPRQKFDRLASGGPSEHQAGLLDKLYAGILEDHFDAEGKKNFVDVMSFILALAAPLPESALRALWVASGRRGGILETVLKGARSVMIGVGDSAEPVQLSHTSLRDFLVDKTRSSPFFIDPDVAQPHLVIASLRIMQTQLAFNICQLQSSYELNNQVRDLSDRIKRYISPECAYACRSWADHLGAVQDIPVLFADERFQPAIHGFLTEKFPFWLEVLSVSGKVAAALLAISTLVFILAVTVRLINYDPCVHSDSQRYCSARRVRTRELEDACAYCKRRTRLCGAVCAGRGPLCPPHISLCVSMDVANLSHIPVLRPPFPWTSQRPRHHTDVAGSRGEAYHLMS